MVTLGTFLCGYRWERLSEGDPMSVIKDFGTFIKKGNVVDLAVAVVIGGAFGKIVSAAVADLVMPLVNALVPQGDWRKWEVSQLHFRVGDFLGTVVDFLIVAFVIFIVMVKLVGSRHAQERAHRRPSDQDLPGMPGDGSDRRAALPGLHQRARRTRWAGEDRLTAPDVSSIAEIAPPTRRSPTFEWRRSRR